MKLIVNADDFGIDLDRDFGIFYGVIKGSITSVSVVVTNKIDVIRKILVKIMRKKASIGIHINLTDNPLIKYNVQELYKQNYKYPKEKHNYWINAIIKSLNYDKIFDEINLQINTFIREYNFIPEHIDGHNHCNIFDKKVERKFEEISRLYKIHLRIPYENIENTKFEYLNSNKYFEEFYRFFNKQINDDIILKNYAYFCKYDMFLNNYMCEKNCCKDKIKFIGTIYGYFRTPKFIESQLKNYKEEDTIQIMTHPGFYWKFISHKTPFSNQDRKKELKSLNILRKKLKMDYSNYRNNSYHTV